MKRHLALSAAAAVSALGSVTIVQETLGQWVASLRETAAGDAADVVLVASNDASDADSIVTAQVYGWLKHQTKAEGSGPIVPVVACNREDVTLRKETTLLLSACGVDYNHLVFLDDPGVGQLLARVSRVILVDHNKAMGPLDALKDKVVEIKDHHKDLGAHPHVFGAQREIAFEGDAATAASVSSVIAEAFLASDTGRELLERDDGAAARALLGVILIDAANLDPAEKKVCPRDSAAAAEMMKIAPAPAQAELYQMLDSAKFCAEFWGGLTLQQAFRYDYKEFTTDGKRYGLAACLCSLELLAAKAGWADEVVGHSKDLDVFGVLTQVRGDGGTGRQLMLYSSDAALATQVATFAQAYSSPSLELEAFELDGPPGIHAFTQGNLAASRKQVQPCVGAFFSSGSSGGNSGTGADMQAAHAAEDQAGAAQEDLEVADSKAEALRKGLEAFFDGDEAAQKEFEAALDQAGTAQEMLRAATSGPLVVAPARAVITVYLDGDHPLHDSVRQGFDAAGVAVEAKDPKDDEDVARACGTWPLPWFFSCGAFLGGVQEVMKVPIGKLRSVAECEMGSAAPREEAPAVVSRMAGLLERPAIFQFYAETAVAESEMRAGLPGGQLVPAEVVQTIRVPAEVVQRTGLLERPQTYGVTPMRPEFAEVTPPQFESPPVTPAQLAEPHWAQVYAHGMPAAHYGAEAASYPMACNAWPGVPAWAFGGVPAVGYGMPAPAFGGVPMDYTPPDYAPMDYITLEDQGYVPNYHPLTMEYTTLEDQGLFTGY